MTHTLNNSMAGFIPECNISFNGGDLSSDTGAILPLDSINSNLLLQPYADLPFFGRKRILPSEKFQLLFDEPADFQVSPWLLVSG